MTFQFHTCRQSNALKNKTLLHFSQVLLCSLALLLPRIFSCLPRSSCLSLALSLPLSPLSLSVCLSFALSSCRVHTVQCVLFLNEAFFLCSQPESFAEARPQLAECGCTVAALVHRESPELAPERERETETEMRQKKKQKKNIQWHSTGYYSYRCALALKSWVRLASVTFPPFFPLKTCT